MKIKYLHDIKKHKPMTVYKARSMLDIQDILKDKKRVNYCKSKGVFLVYFSS